MQKYPTHGRTQQRKKANHPTCCRSKAGLNKKRFITQADAEHTMSQYTDKEYEVYPCQTGGGYHIRTKRQGTR